MVAAGCTDLFASTSRPELPGGRVLDITAIDGLRGIRRARGSWWIGPTTSWSAIRSAGYLPPAFDALRQAALATDIPVGGTLMGYGVKFNPPEHAMAGQNDLASPVVVQYIDNKAHIVWPKELQSLDPVLPLPSSSPYAK